MDEAVKARIIKRLRKEVFLPGLAELRQALEDLRERPLEAFLEALGPIVSEARMLFREMIEVMPDGETPPELNQAFYAYFISDTNSLLPADYPFIIAVANIRRERRFCFIGIARRNVTKFFPGLAGGAIPIISVETKADLESGNFTNIDVANTPEDMRIVSID